MIHYRTPFGELPLCAAAMERTDEVVDTMADVDCQRCVRAFIRFRDSELKAQRRRLFQRPKKFR